MTEQRLQRIVPIVLIVCGALGALAAAILTIEKIRVLQDPTYVPSCSLNPILSCGSVMESDQAEAFGFPNPLIGIAGFTTVLVTGVSLRAGAELKRWYWLGLQGGVLLGTAFVAWLTYQSLYRIGALCPYCLIVWAVIPVLTIYVTCHNIVTGHLGRRMQRVGALLVRNHTVVLTLWYLTVATLILKRFWDYWQSLVT